MLEKAFRNYHLYKPPIEGKYVDSATSAKFESYVMAVVRAKRRKPRIAIDMSDIKYMSTAGHRTLLMAFKEAEKTGGSIALANVNDEVWGKLDMLGFSSNFRRTTLLPAKK